VNVKVVQVTGIWLQKDTEHNGNGIRVLAEVDGEWRVIITETSDDGPISHIVEPAGIQRSPKWQTTGGAGPARQAGNSL
jgi:hypothetical protein